MVTKLRSREEWKGTLQDGGRSKRPATVLLSMQEIVGRKWHSVIVKRLLDDGPMGFNELQESINDVSAKMLSDSLDDLEERGLIERSIISEKPFRVEYSLTECGRELEPLIEEMVSWGRRHVA
jgi:DNA-binding HxlR family transcriptional regulator